MRRAILISIAILFASCGFHARPFICRPSEEAAKAWACREKQACGPNVGLIRVGDELAVSSDLTKGAKADWWYELPREVTCPR